MDSGMGSNYRSPVLMEPSLMPPGIGGSTIEPAVLRTPFAGNVRSLPPPLPQLPMQQTQLSYGQSAFGNSYGSGGYGGFGNSFGGYGGFGSGGYGYGNSFGGYGGGFGGAFNRFGGGMNPMDPESRFIQLAEDSSRPAFQSIESLVSAFGNIAAMLDSTFFALTSSFRAVLGVAANFGRLRGVFAQFWQTFAIFRGFTWFYRKLLYWLRISDLDPSSDAFKKAFVEAVNETTSTQMGAPTLPRKGQSAWPVLAFLSFIFTAPYLIMKLLGTVTKTAQEEARNPNKWINPIETVAIFDFQARNTSELTIRAGERIFIAPKEIQNTQGLLNTGWAMASIDGQVAGIVPVNYVKSPQQLREEQRQQQQTSTLKSDGMNLKTNVPMQQAQELMNLAPNAFAPPPAVSDFDIAPQPIASGPTTLPDIGFDDGGCI